MSSITQTIPLFPLDIVLFPGMVLPLHIFEPRYRQMVQDCIADGQPFGMVWVEREPVQLDPTQPLVGTMAMITDVDLLEDGRFNINAVGYERFLLQSISYDEPYLVGHIAGFPSIGAESEDARGYFKPLSRLLRDYLKLLGRAAEQEVKLDPLPDDPTSLAFVVAILYQCENWRKQQLLAVESIPDLMREEIELLSLENPLIEHSLRMRDEGRLPPLLGETAGLYGLN
jgi:Lon protease-like protein